MSSSCGSRENNCWLLDVHQDSEENLPCDLIPNGIPVLLCIKLSNFLFCFDLESSPMGRESYWYYIGVLHGICMGPVPCKVFDTFFWCIVALYRFPLKPLCCSSGWPWVQSFQLSFLSYRLTSVCHHSWWVLFFEIQDSYSICCI